jgi:hypothetical protein
MKTKGAQRSGKVGWRLAEEFDHTRESKAFLKYYREWLTKNMGRRCRARCNGCACCQAWTLFDMTEVFLP